MTTPYRVQGQRAETNPAFRAPLARNYIWYLRLKRSTRPAVSTMFCFPV